MEWLWILIAVVVIMIIGYWLAQRAKDDEHVAATASAREVSATESAPVTPDPQAASDDLRKIEGIGPKIAELMNEGGIRTLRQGWQHPRSNEFRRSSTRQASGTGYTTLPVGRCRQGWPPKVNGQNSRNSRTVSTGENSNRSG